MKLSLFLTIHLNAITTIGTIGFLLLLRGNWIGGMLLLGSGIYANIIARMTINKVSDYFTSVAKNFLEFSQPEDYDETKIPEHDLGPAPYQ